MGALLAALALGACQPERPEEAQAPAAAPQTTDDVTPAAVPPTIGEVPGSAGDTAAARPQGPT